MKTLSAVYKNELYKISKKKKIMVATVLSAAAVIIAALAVYFISSFAGIRVTGNSEFAVLVLSFFCYTLIPLFTAFICIDMFGGEFSDKTIKLTLTTPATRFTVYLGKVLAAATFIIADLLLIMVLSIIASFFIDGTSYGILRILLSYVSCFAPLFVFALAVVVISNITKGTTGAFMLSVLLFLIFVALGAVFPKMESLLFTSAFKTYRLFGDGYINYSKIFRVLMSLVGYAIMLFGAGFYLFEKKEI